MKAAQRAGLILVASSWRGPLRGRRQRSAQVGAVVNLHTARSERCIWSHVLGPVSAFSQNTHVVNNVAGARVAPGKL